MLNLANPAAAFRWWRLPADGVGLARMEFVVSNHVRVHPMALVRFDELTDEAAQGRDRGADEGLRDRRDYFVDHLARGLSRIARRGASEAGHHPDERLQDQRICGAARRARSSSPRRRTR